MSNQRRESKPIKSLQVKLHNRRVIGGLMWDGSIAWKFKRLLPDRTVHVERIRLSLEAINAMEVIKRKLEDYLIETLKAKHKAAAPAQARKGDE